LLGEDLVNPRQWRQAYVSRQVWRCPRLVEEFVKSYVSTGTDLSFLLGAAIAKAKQLREF
jgi:hypothetical protein